MPLLASQQSLRIGAALTLAASWHLRDVALHTNVALCHSRIISKRNVRARHVS